VRIILQPPPYLSPKAEATPPRIGTMGRCPSAAGHLVRWVSCTGLAKITVADRGGGGYGAVGIIASAADLDLRGACWQRHFSQKLIP